MFRQPLDGRGVIELFGALRGLVTVVTTLGPEGPRGMSIEPLTAPRNEPPLVMVPFPAQSALKEEIREAGQFCVNCLDASAHEETARAFAARQSDVWQSVRWHSGLSGPVLDDAGAWISCSVEIDFESGLYEFVVGHATLVEADLRVLGVESS